MTCPGIAWVLGYTIAAELGDVGRFQSPRKLSGYTGLCPRVDQSGERDRRGRLRKNGPRYLRWALIEAAQHAGSSRPYRELAERKRTQYPGPRGKKIANISVARKLAEAIWDMLTRDQPFAPAGAAPPLAV
jgi:transposase